MRKLLSLLFLTILALNTSAQGPNVPMNYKPSAENLAAREKFQDMKFGMFIHWGIYSILGDGEWVMFQRKIPYQSYKRLAGFFNPQEFDAKEWVSLVKNAGMKYITITSRHHDGFSMFHTKASPYNIVDATPYKKDPIMELAQECQKQGIQLNFYYSLLDWGREDYGFGKPIVNGAPVGAKWDSYISFMKTQLTELITKYPNIGAIWFDGHWERPEVNWHYNEIYGLIHKLNPKILVGNNHHLAPLPGEDFQMFERDLPGENKSGFSEHSQVGNLPLETCETINNTWGFNINDRSFKTVKQIIHYLANAAGRNANLLLNVGPMPNGEIQSEFADTLSAVGTWINKYGKSIYNTRGNTIPPQPWGVLTSANKTHYAHVLTKTGLPYIFLPAFKEKIQNVNLLATGKSIQFKQVPEGVFIYTNQISFDPYDTVIQINSN